ncbi:MAG: alanyl-tRNA editing protein, partial [Pseudomonadota bacterium]
VKLAIDWQRRLCHMRMHTALHLLCALLPHSVTGCQIGAAKSRMDFDPEGNQFSKEKLQQDLQALITANHSVNVEWISDSELAAQPELVRTMSVKPPSGQGRVRLLRIGDAIDLQPCGGTHLRTTGEIGAMKIAKIENKGRANRRVSIVFAD